MAPRHATAATDGRMSDSIGDAGEGQRPGGLVGEHLERPEQHRDEQQDRDQPQRRRLQEPRQPDDGHRRQREVAAAESVVHRADGTRDVHRGRALTSGPASPATQASSSSRGRVFRTFAGSTQARRAWLMPQRT